MSRRVVSIVRKQPNGCGNLCEAMNPSRYILMITKRTSSLFSVVAVCRIIAFWGCRATRDPVRVTDDKSGLPIEGAQVLPIYPSFNGVASSTDRNGVARIRIPRGGYGVRIWAPGYGTNFVGTFATVTNHNGWSGNQMEVSLVPIEK